MKFISHRGNLTGPNPSKENSPEFILESITSGFECEIDVWYVNGKFMLGHDFPVYPIDLEFLKNDKLWCHAKNLEALDIMLDNNVHCFWHENDQRTLTSRNYVWTFPNQQVCNKSVIVILTDKITKINMDITGVCGDYVVNWK